MENLFNKIKKYPIWLQVVIVILSALILYLSSCKSFSTVNDTSIKVDSVYIKNLDFISQKRISAEND